jgi:hypothetical protein
MTYSFEKATSELRTPMVNPVDMPLYTINMGPEFVSTWVFGPSGGPAIPAEFFGSGSDPWIGSISCVGVPLDTRSVAPTADMVVRHERIEWIPNPEKRYGPAEIPKNFTLRCEMVKLSERGTEPITVTYGGGQRSEEWNVTVEISKNHPGGGRIEITHINADGNGGLADIELAVKVVFKFTRPGRDQLEAESDVEWLSETNHSFVRWLDQKSVNQVHISSESQGNFIPTAASVGGETIFKGACSKNATVSHSFVLPPQEAEIKGAWGTFDAIRQFPRRFG